MYLQNKYTLWYYNIIDRAKSRVTIGYTEKHHIVPKGLGGTDDSSNLVKLTAREHFICHWLLTKMLGDGVYRWKMMYAFNSFNRINKNQKRHTPTSKQYEIMKKMASVARSMLNMGNQYNKGKKRSLESIEKWRESRAGYKQSESAKIKQSETMKQKYANVKHPLNGLSYEEKYGVEEAQARRNKLKVPRRPRLVKRTMPTSECPHCGKVGAVSNMRRYHFHNCSKL